ncbi:CidA/LrgA family protein [Erysipelothrix urinaevulpis]|uniref:CidA/LrgA family protein n=1 Tax=Erysipelothrix urinaevulpis TaxID=2683717 RepID=UPI00135C55A2|nr:CidA/LrgA family protein [Erysipelothrix urinaevulpis]
MKIIKELFIIFLFSMLGELASFILSDLIVIPGSVIGMVLFFLMLHFKFISLDSVKESGTWLTNNMGIFFVPVGVGLINNFDILATSWMQLTITILISTALMLVFVGRLTQALKERGS